MLLLMSIDNCTVKYNNAILFHPDWGMFDMICGEEVTTAFGGAADKVNFHKFVDKDIKKDIPLKKILSEKDQQLNSYYKQIRNMRENNDTDILELKNIYNTLKQDFPDEWLLLYEILEIIGQHLNFKKNDKLNFDNLNCLSAYFIMFRF